MNHATSYLRPATEGRTIGVVGDVYRFLATGAETGGRFTLWEALVPPGGGPPPHIHLSDAESFYVLEGEMTFQIGEERRTVGAGTFASIAPGELHCFKNESGKPARMLIQVAPAGIEEMFFEVGQPVPPGATSAPPPDKADIDKLLAAAPRYVIEMRIPH